MMLTDLETIGRIQYRIGGVPIAVPESPVAPRTRRMDWVVGQE